METGGLGARAARALTSQPFGVWATGVLHNDVIVITHQGGLFEEGVLVVIFVTFYLCIGQHYVRVGLPRIRQQRVRLHPLLCLLAL